MLKKNYAAKYKEFIASPLLPFYRCEYALQRSRMHFLENVLRSDSTLRAEATFSR